MSASPERYIWLYLLSQGPANHPQSWPPVECYKVFKCSLQTHSRDLLFESDQSWHFFPDFSILCWSQWGNPSRSDHKNFLPFQLMKLYEEQNLVFVFYFILVQCPWYVIRQSPVYQEFCKIYLSKLWRKIQSFIICPIKYSGESLVVWLECVYYWLS